MTMRDQILQMEGRLKLHGVKVQEVCDEAEVNRATYQRWKAGDVTPLMTTWTRLTEAAQKLIDQAAKPTGTVAVATGAGACQTIRHEDAAE